MGKKSETQKHMKVLQALTHFTALGINKQEAAA